MILHLPFLPLLFYYVPLAYFHANRPLLSWIRPLSATAVSWQVLEARVSDLWIGNLMQIPLFVIHWEAFFRYKFLDVICALKQPHMQVPARKSKSPEEAQTRQQQGQSHSNGLHGIVPASVQEATQKVSPEIPLPEERIGRCIRKSHVSRQTPALPGLGAWCR